ncbi:MAG: aspartate--tRNA(Asn) ligase [Candidatus Aenigmatarchaeota archaeon]
MLKTTKSIIKINLKNLYMQIQGWVEEIRNLGGIKFLKLHTTSGNYQVTLTKKDTPKDLFDSVDNITRQSAIRVIGKEKKNNEAPGGIEIIPEKIEVLGLSETPLPLDPSGKTPAELDTRLDWRILDFRNKNTLSIFKIQNQILKTFRTFLINEGFMEIQPPSIIASATEGGADLFSIPYFEKEAYLAQSPQLYKQMGAISFGKVFCISPVWRAEKFNTPTHLNEIRQMDIEMGFIDSEEDVMKVLERVLQEIIKSVNKNCMEELKLLGQKLVVPKLPIKRVTYNECIDALKKRGEKIEWGEDFSKPQERILSEIFGDVFFLKDWPTDIKAFYAMPYEDNPKLCHAFDLIFRGIEISSGTQRIHKPDLLIKQLKLKGLNPENFKFYIDCFRYGAPPHAGWSIGLERLTMTLTGVKNIREACMFPRDRQRLSP